MKILIQISIVVSFLLSCRKDIHSCSPKELEGAYYSSAINRKILVTFDKNKPDLLRTELPRIHPYNFHHLHVELEMNGCSFTIKPFYDNYAESAYGTHYWIVGDGNGAFESNELILNYHVKVSANYGGGSPVDATLLLDKDISNSFEKM